MADKRIGTRAPEQEAEAAAARVQTIERDRIVAELKRLGAVLSTVESDIALVRGRLDRIEASLTP